MTQSSGGPGSGGTGDGGHRPHRAESNGEARSDSTLPGSRRLRGVAASSGSHAGRAYQGAVEAVFAIVIATGIGYWADTRYGTSPRWLIVGAIIGFGAFVLRLARMAKLVADPMPGAGGAPGGPAEPEASSESGAPGNGPDDEASRGGERRDRSGTE